MGYIGEYVAPSLTGPWSLAYKFGWTNSDSTFSSTGMNQLLNSIPGLTDCVTFTEPGAIVITPAVGGSYILLALSGIYVNVNMPYIKVILLRSDNFGQSFTLINANFLSATAGVQLGFGVNQMSATQLSFYQNQLYASITPSNTTTGPGSNGMEGYMGCLIYRIDSDYATINVQPIGYIVANDYRFNGACTFYETSNTGFILGGFYYNPINPKPYRMMIVGTAATDTIFQSTNIVSSSFSSTAPASTNPNPSSSTGSNYADSAKYFSWSLLIMLKVLLFCIVL